MNKKQLYLSGRRKGRARGDIFIVILKEGIFHKNQGSRCENVLGGMFDLCSVPTSNDVHTMDIASSSFTLISALTTYKDIIHSKKDGTK
jgi:hypothetical protein